MNTLEKNTNSIKDALVNSTRDAAHNAGMLEGVKSERDRMDRTEK